MDKKKSLYLANDYGFSKIAKEALLPLMVKELELIGIDVWEPFERNNQIDFSNEGWSYRIGQADFADVRDSDGIFAVVNGCPPDEGVMIELGMAIALEKPVFLYRDDFRRSTDCEEYPLNLMVFTALPEHNWQDYYYTSIDEIANPNKALMKWLETQ